MSRRAKQPAASRRTRRAEVARPPGGLAEAPQIVSNPIFRCEAGPSQPKPPGDQLRCVYGPNSLYALVHDPGAGSDLVNGNARPLPLPPSRAHPSARAGPARAVWVPHGRPLRRTPHQDPFLAAYVACSKGAGAGRQDDAGAERPQHRQQQGRRRRRKEKATAGKSCKEGEVVFRRCGIWNGWAAGAKYAGAMSCRSGCAVAAQEGADAPAPAAKSRDDAPAGPTLDLSWTPAVLSARALERRQHR